MIILLNGRKMREDEAAIPVTDRGFLLGDGVFDTMLAADGILQHAARHFTRLVRHASVLGIPCPYDPAALTAQAHDILAANNAFSGLYALRTTLTHGSGARGLAAPEKPSPALVMRLSPAPAVKQNISLMIAQSTRRNEFSPLSQIKSLNYGDSLIAHAEAAKTGADDAILLNTRGNICCASAANILVIKGEDTITPPLADGVLDGVTRAILLDAGLIHEQSMTTNDLTDCSGVMLINSLRRVQVATKINGREIPRPPHSVMEKLVNALGMMDQNQISGDVPDQNHRTSAL